MKNLKKWLLEKRIAREVHDAHHHRKSASAITPLQKFRKPPKIPQTHDHSQDWIKLTKEYLAQGQNIAPVPAHALYETAVYGSVGFGEMEDFEADAVNERIRILDPYLGLARPFDKISPGCPEMRWGMKFGFGSKMTTMQEYWKEAVGFFDYLLCYI